MNIYKRLCEAKTENKITSVFTDEEDRSLFTPGYIDAIDQSWVRIKILENYGSFDGYGVRPLSSVVDVVTDSDFEESLKKLTERKPKPVFPEFSIIDNGDSILISSITYAHKSKLPITFWDMENKDEYIGHIDNIFDDKFRFRRLKAYGIEAGISTFKVGDIFMLDVGGNMERSYLFLNQSK
tara:strand:- start:1587 stop:2132 length:546 start_codon:yes stop_codon:yes gene_type:complete